MSGINPILTQVAAGSSGQPATPQALQGGATGLFASGGGSFFDMIIAHFAAGEGDAAAKTTGVTNENAANTLLAGTTVEQKIPAAQKGANPLAALQIALAAQNVDAQGNIVVAPATPENAGSIQTQLDVTNQIINHLKNMLPENAQQDGVFNKILAKLQTKSETLQASLSALENGVITKDTPVEDIPMPLLISLGLTPAQINEATQKIQDLEKKLGRDITVEDLIAGVGGIVPPAPEHTVVASLQASAKGSAPLPADIDALTDSAAEPTDDLAAQLNALDVGGEDVSSEDALSAKGSFKASEDTAETDIIAPKANAAAEPAPKKDAATFKDNIVNLLNNNHQAQQQPAHLTFPANGFASDADATIYAQYGLSPTMSTSLGTTAQAANLVSSPTVAGQNHPATQMVAATLTKSARDGNEQVMTLRLDPPELGNVSVRLQFGKDKAVKALISAEKPETFMMLQRDAHSLERALQSAGLDTAAADSISFELAQDNGAFNPNHGDDANAGNGKSSASASDASGAEEIIQSSVSWQVDATTGHVRYNIFA